MLKLGWRNFWKPSLSLFRASTLSSAFSPAVSMPTTLQSKSSVGSMRLQHSDGRTAETKVQFPELPREWQGKYVKGEMYKYQDSLPKLPVPPLQQTLKKYLAAIRSLLSDDEFEKTKKNVEEFGRPGGMGELLQKILLQRAEAKESWLLEWWNEVAYLGFREPVVVHSNPAVGFPLQPHGNQDIYVSNVTGFIISILKWNLIIQNKAVPPDIYRKRPMCMSQYDFYSKCRIPKLPVDVSQQAPFSESRHVILIRNGHFYKLDIIYECPDGTLAMAPPTHIMAEVRKVLETAPESCDRPVGILTTEHRDSWARTREELAQDPVNKSTLEAIETAQGIFSLDNAASEVESSQPHSRSKFWDQHKTMLANRYLHGNGSRKNSCNRWFDSAIQILIGEDGGAGSNLEHSAADGPCAITVDLFALDLMSVQDVLSDSSPVPDSVLSSFEPLHWNITPRVASDIQTAMTKLDKLAADVDLQVATYTDYGKDFPKIVKLSPDGFIQNAILLTYYKMYGEMTAMYESGGTRWFKLGRTDTIRNTSFEAHTFVKTMTDPSATNNQKADTLIESIKAHSQYTNEAIEGQVFDRHLLGLRLIAKENGFDMPEIFNDPSYGKSLHFCLSTSQVPVQNYEIFLCFGPVVPDGYGVCYNPQEKQVIFSVSSFHSCPKTDSHLFLQRLTETMGEMRQVMVAAKGLPAKL